MTIRILDYARRHAIAVLALICSILAMAGSSYAAFTISGSQIRDRTIDPTKFNPKFINGTVRAWAVVRANGQVAAGAGGPRVFPFGGIPGFWGIRWHVTVPGRCEPSATVDAGLSPPTEITPNASLTVGYAVATTLGHPRNRNRGDQTGVDTFNQSGQPTPLGFDVAVIC